MAHEDDAITPVVAASSSSGAGAAPPASAAPAGLGAPPSLSPISERDAADGSGSGPSDSDATGSAGEPFSSSVQVFNPADPMNFGRHRRDNVSRAQMKIDHPNAKNGKHRELKKFYTQQNELIDQFLGAGDEERMAVEEDIRMGPRIKFAVYGSFCVNLCLFCIQLYAAISTGSLSVRATSVLGSWPRPCVQPRISCLALSKTHTIPKQDGC